MSKPEDRTADGIVFQSKAEMNRYMQLKLLLKYKHIRNLELQPRFPLRVNGVVIGEYRADFSYEDEDGSVRVVEDVKGVRTPMYKFKRKLVKALYGIDIQEV